MLNTQTLTASISEKSFPKTIPKLLTVSKEEKAKK